MKFFLYTGLFFSVFTMPLRGMDDKSLTKPLPPAATVLKKSPSLTNMAKGEATIRAWQAKKAKRASLPTPLKPPATKSVQALDRASNLVTPAPLLVDSHQKQPAAVLAPVVTPAPVAILYSVLRKENGFKINTDEAHKLHKALVSNNALTNDQSLRLLELLLAPHIEFVVYEGYYDLGYRLSANVSLGGHEIVSFYKLLSKQQENQAVAALASVKLAHIYWNEKEHVDLTLSWNKADIFKHIAVRLYRKVASQDHNLEATADAMVALAEIYHQSKSYHSIEEATEFYTKVAQQRHSIAAKCKALMALAGMHEQEENKDLALQCYRDAMKEQDQSTHAQAEFRLARMLADSVEKDAFELHE